MEASYEFIEGWMDKDDVVETVKSSLNIVIRFLETDFKLKDYNETNFTIGNWYKQELSSFGIFLVTKTSPHF